MAFLRAIIRAAGRAIDRLFCLLLLGLIGLYRYTLSAFIGRTCRHLPTCSEYARDAIQIHGAWPGFWMGISRWFRCSPWGTHGFDPVPQALPERAAWYLPWRYGQWVKSNDNGSCDEHL